MAMEPSAGTLVVTCAVSVDRILGLVSQGLGDLDKALEHLEAAMDLCHPSEYLPEYAWSASALVDVLAARGATGDKARAEGLIEECVAIVDQVGMHALRERLSGARDRVAAMPARARAFPAGLTPREVEVLRIVASGKSNLRSLPSCSLASIPSRATSPTSFPRPTRSVGPRLPYGRPTTDSFSRVTPEDIAHDHCLLDPLREGCALFPIDAPFLPVHCDAAPTGSVTPPSEETTVPCDAARSVTS